MGVKFYDSKRTSFGLSAAKNSGAGKSGEMSSEPWRGGDKKLPGRETVGWR